VLTVNIERVVNAMQSKYSVMAAVELFWLLLTTCPLVMCIQLWQDRLGFGLLHISGNYM
jgi:hypothetical protein